MFQNMCSFIKLNIYRSHTHKKDSHKSEECIVSQPVRNPILAQLIAFHTRISGAFNTKCGRRDELRDELRRR